MLNATRTLWTPVVTCLNPGDLVVTYPGFRSGYWAQAGSVVVINFDVQFTPTYTTATGTLLITGFPPSPPDLFNAGSLNLTPNFTWPTGMTMLTPSMSATPQGAPAMLIRANGSASASTVVVITNLTSGAISRFQGTLTAIEGP